MTAVVSVGPARSPVAGRRLLRALGVVGAVVCALSAAITVHWSASDERVWRGALELLVAGVPIAAGLYAMRNPHDARFGAILVTTGFVWSLTALAQSPDSLPYSIGRVAGWLVFPGLIYLMLAFPDGRVAPGTDRALFGALNLVLVVLYIGSALFVERYPALTPWTSCTRNCPANAFLVLPSEPGVMAGVVAPVREALTALLFAGVTVSLAARWRATPPLRRQLTAPVVCVSATSVVLLVAFFAARRIGGDESQTALTIGVLWSLCIPALAAAFLAGLLQRRLLVGGVLARLGGLLQEQGDARGVRDVLAAGLRDPSLELLVPDGPARWRDSSGRPAGDLSTAAGGRHVTLIRDGRGAEAAIVHDAEAVADAELLAAVGGLILASLQQQRLKSRLASSLVQLDTSRRRIARAADQERERIERDLHDGAQQRLIALRLRLTLAEELLHTDPEAGMAAVVALGGELDLTLDELRSLAHGVYPSMLRDRGVAQALRGIAAQAPLPVHVQAFGLTRHSTELDTAVYFTCLEAVQNAIKHAATASGVWILLRQTDALTVEVRDDGPGFSPAAANGHGDGLRNMRDRIEAVGGRLTIESAPGEGTRVLAFVPLG